MSIGVGHSEPLSGEINTVPEVQLHGFNAHAAFAVWLIPHFVCLVAPLLIAFLHYRRWQVSLRHYLIGTACACTVIWFINPATARFTRPGGPVRISRYWLEDCLVSSVIVLVVSGMLAWVICSIKAHRAKSPLT